MLIELLVQKVFLFYSPHGVGVHPQHTGQDAETSDDVPSPVAPHG